MLLRRLHKKGFEIQQLLIIVVVIVGFFVVVEFGTSLVAYAKGPTAEIVCQGTVTARNNFVIGYGVGEQKLSPLLCQTQDAPIKIKNADAVKREIANLATKCWWEFGNGQYSKTFYNTFPVKIDFNTYCFVCYSVSLDGLDGSFTGAELQDWMGKNTYSQPVELKQQEQKEGVEQTQKGVSYYTYVTNTNNAATASGRFIIDQNLKFEDGGLYAVVFFEPHTTAGVDTPGIAIDTMAKALNLKMTDESGNNLCSRLWEGVNG